MVNFDGDCDGDGTCKQTLHTWMSLPNKYEMGVDASYIPREFKILAYHIALFKILILMCSKKIHKLFYNNVIFNSMKHEEHWLTKWSNVFTKIVSWLKWKYTLYCCVVVRLWYTGFCLQRIKKQECIPVGCVPSAAVAVWWWGGGVWEGVCPDTPFCEQNDRRLWKHYLVGTTLRTVIKAFERKLFLVTKLFNTCMIAVHDFGLEKYARCNRSRCKRNPM